MKWVLVENEFLTEENEANHPNELSHSKKLKQKRGRLEYDTASILRMLQSGESSQDSLNATHPENPATEHRSSQQSDEEVVFSFGVGGTLLYNNQPLDNQHSMGAMIKGSLAFENIYKNHDGELIMNAGVGGMGPLNNRHDSGGKALGYLSLDINLLKGRLQKKHPRKPNVYLALRFLAVAATPQTIRNAPMLGVGFDLNAKKFSSKLKIMLIPIAANQERQYGLLGREHSILFGGDFLFRKKVTLNLELLAGLVGSTRGQLQGEYAIQKGLGFYGQGSVGATINLCPKHEEIECLFRPDLTLEGQIYTVEMDQPNPGNGNLSDVSSIPPRIELKNSLFGVTPASHLMIRF